jgi:putative aldouronate transport system substrate-binding protein
VTDYEDNDLTKWIEETTGLNIEVQQFSGSNTENTTQIALMIASGEKLPDILAVAGISARQTLEYGQDGYFIDLAPYFGKYDYYHKEAFERLFPDDPTVRETMMYCATEPTSGAIYTFPLMENAPGDTPTCHTWINRTWLDKLGLQAPTTIDELREVLIAFRDKDPNGNGKQDEIPMVGKSGTTYNDIVRYLVNAFIFWNGQYHFNVDENGKIYTPYTEDEYRQALIFISDLVKDGLLSTLTWTQSSAELKSLFNPEAGEPELCGIITGHGTLNLVPNSPSLYDYEPLAPLKDATGRGGFGPRGDYNYENELHITSSCEHPVEAFKLLDFLCSDEGFLRCRYGVPGRDWEFIEDEQTADPRGAKMIRRLGDDTFSTQNNIHWHMTLTINDYNYHTTKVAEGDEWTVLKGQKSKQNLQNYIDAGQPEKVFTNVAYTLEENERLAEIQKELTDFIKDRRAQFCTGTMDPRDDAQWQTYLDGLKGLNYDEWVSIAQAAYDRMETK